MVGERSINCRRWPVRDSLLIYHWRKWKWGCWH